MTLPERLRPLDRLLARAPLFGAGLALFAGLVLPGTHTGVLLLVLLLAGRLFPRLRWLSLILLVGFFLRPPVPHAATRMGIFRVEEDRVVAVRLPGDTVFHPLSLRLAFPLTPPGYRRIAAGTLHLVGDRGMFRGDTLPVEPAPGWRARIRRWVHHRLEVFPSRTRGVFEALLLGNRRGLPRDVRNDLKKAGLYHILALSGLHVGFWLGMVWLAGLLLGLPFRWRYVLLLAGILAFLWLQGGRPSLLRASLMAGLWAFSRLLSRPLSLLQVWGGALFLSLLFFPHQATAPGFLLSFLATGGIFLVLPEVRNLPVWLQGFAVSLGASLATWPYLAWAMGGVNLLAPVWNALALPLVGLAYAEAMLSLAGGVPFAWIAHRVMEGLLFAAERLPGFLDVRLGSAEMLGLYALLLGVYAFQSRRRVPT